MFTPLLVTYTARRRPRRMGSKITAQVHVIYHAKDGIIIFISPQPPSLLLLYAQRAETRRRKEISYADYYYTNRT